MFVCSYSCQNCAVDCAQSCRIQNVAVDQNFVLKSVWCTLHTFECDIMVPAMFLYGREGFANHFLLSSDLLGIIFNGKIGETGRSDLKMPLLAYKFGVFSLGAA